MTVKKMLAGALGALTMLGTMAVAAPSAGATQPATICPSYGDGSGESGGSTKIDVVGEQKTVTVTAPDGFLISGYCVKAGQLQTLVEIDPPQETVVISSPNGKGVSHYSVIYVPDVPSS